jgi:hypothetical protein
MLRSVEGGTTEKEARSRARGLGKLPEPISCKYCSGSDRYKTSLFPKEPGPDLSSPPLEVGTILIVPARAPWICAGLSKWQQDRASIAGPDGYKMRAHVGHFLPGLG